MTVTVRPNALEAAPMSHDLPPGRGKTRSAKLRAAALLGATPVPPVAVVPPSPTKRSSRAAIGQALVAAAAMLGDAPNASAPVRFVRRRAKHLIELDANRDIIRIVPPHGPEEDAARELRAVEKRRRKNRGRLAAVQRGGLDPK